MNAFESTLKNIFVNSVLNGFKNTNKRGTFVVYVSVNCGTFSVECGSKDELFKERSEYQDMFEISSRTDFKKNMDSFVNRFFWGVENRIAA